MAQNVSVAGATYSDVPAVELPKSDGGTATFIDETSAVLYESQSGKTENQKAIARANIDASSTGQTIEVGKMASEADFKAESLLRAYTYDFDTLCVETFCDSDDIDTTLNDGAYVVANFFDSEKHVINKTTTDTRVIQSAKFEVSNIPYKALVLIDYDGDGSVTAQISKNNGDDWFTLPNDTLTDLNGLVQKDIRVKLTLTGVVRLKNISWGIK